MTPEQAERQKKLFLGTDPWVLEAERHVVWIPPRSTGWGTSIVPFRYFDTLPEYSTSLPTGQRFGKKWRRRIIMPEDIPKDFFWALGEYVDLDDPENIGIRWSHLEIAETFLLSKFFEVGEAT